MRNTLKSIGWGGVFFCFSSSLGCSNLPELAFDSCGNFVIDEHEDCDTYTVAESHRCARPDEPNACHYTCGAEGVTCPDGFGCGQDQVCRRSSRSFEPQTEAQGYVWPTSIHTGDFDSDGNGDLLLLGPADSFGYRAARALYSQGFSLRSGLSILPTELANPAIGAGSEEAGLRDIAFADFEGVALLRGYPDRSADFTVFPTTTLSSSTHARIAMGDALPDRPGDEIVALLENEDGTSEVSGIELGRKPITLASAPGGEEALAQPYGFFAKRFDETDLCVRVVIAYAKASSVELVTPCRSTGTKFEWNTGATLDSIQLQPPAEIDLGVIGFDIDFDGYRDLVIGASGRTYVAFGLGNGQFISKKANGVVGEAAPYDLPLAAGGSRGFPLAIADLNADSKPDFVIPKGVVLSTSTNYEFAYRNLGAPWSEALVSNLNANDQPDIVAVVDGALDVHFLNNAGNGVFGTATLPTEGPPKHLTSGDFDGDLLQDLVFSEEISEHGQLSDHLSFSFGTPFGPPAFPVATGEVGELGQIVVGHFQGQSGPDPMSELGVVVEGQDGRADSIALLPGRASRAIFSTLSLQKDTTPYLPVSLAFGHFGDDTEDIAALAANTSNGGLSLFRIEAFDEEGLSVPEASDDLLANFIPADAGNAVNLRYGAIVVPADFDKDMMDEVLVVGAYVDQQQGAFALAGYDTSRGKFHLIDAQVFPAQITVDSTMFIDDLNGDGYPDVVLTTGTQASPSDLILVWGDGSAHVPDLQTSLQRLRFEGQGVTAVAKVQSPAGKGKMLVASTPGKTYLLELTAERTWTSTEIPQIGPARSFGVIDFDRDGVEDLAVQLEDGLELVRSVPK
ncbi:MAG TPA: VCBS repeat-containing protein [Polyangium sp.]|nr:VCBS repeat-containing protein [Polyangium sp.]